MSKIRKLCISFSLLFLTIIVRANETIQINQKQYFIDTTKNLVLSNIDVQFVNSNWTDIKTHILLNEVCEFLNPIANIEIGKAYSIYIPSKNANFLLYFTELPIISIDTNNTIVDEPNVLAKFQMIDSNQNFLESYIGIQYRGATSQSLPKKSMEIEFWTDSTGNKTQDHSLLGMVNDDDWNLQAMYNEPLRIRSKTNNDLWRMINTLHYQDQEPEAINGIRMRYVELFINNDYRGIYCLGEKVNRKQLKLKKYNGIIKGELYKGISWGGATTFIECPPYNNNSITWGGFELKYPKEEINWTNLHDLVNFVINSSNQVFFDQYKNRFELDNLVDYYIFLNLLLATDNRGKNIYIAKYTTNDKYFYVPWDLDGSFGIMWDGRNNSTTNDLRSNGFYDRLTCDCSTDGFRMKLKNKWLELRSSVITHDSLMSLFTSNHDYLATNGIYSRENLAWTDYIYNNTDLNYMSSWINDRLDYLDLKFTEDCIITTPEEKKFNIYPNPTNGLIYLKSSQLLQLNDYKVYIYNNLGQTVLKETLIDLNEKIHLQNIKRGVYYIKIENERHHEIHKVILVE